MIREADTANRFVEEKNHERQYRQHMKTMKTLKPTLDTHYDAPAKYRKDNKATNQRVRIFDGQKAVRKMDQDVDSIAEKKKPVEMKSARPVERKLRLDSKPTKTAPADKTRAQTARPAASRPVSSTAKPTLRTQKKDDLIRKKTDTTETTSARKTKSKITPSVTDRKKLVNSPAQSKPKPKPTTTPKTKTEPEPVKEVRKPAVIEEYQVTYGLDMWDTSYDEDEEDADAPPAASPVLFDDADFDYSDEI